jgi:peptidylprolyl isomerase
MRSSSRLALLALVGMASTVWAQEGTKPAQQSSTPPAATAPSATGQPAAPEAPKGIPVPDGPVVNKQDLEGGILAEDLKIGTGYEVKAGGAVVAHYHGTLKADPTKVFDSSFQRGEPVGFPLSGVIKGWQTGVPGMKIGGVRRLTIPAELAYGAQSPSPEIPPNSDLVFVIELVDALQMTDTTEGTGDAATGQCVAVTAYTIKDKDGKEIEKADATKPYIWLPGEYQAIQFGLEGMKVGGKRTITVPKEMNQTNPQAGGTRPNNIPVTIDVELIAVRNLGRR